MLSIEAGIIDILENPDSIFCCLLHDEKEELKRNISVSRYRKNECIFREGERPSGFLLLARGKVKLYKEGVGGREQIIRMATSHEIIGFRALLAEELYVASAVTIEESLICNVSFDYIYNRAMRNFDFTMKLIRVLSKEFGFSDYWTVSLTQKHIRGRLAESLLILKEKYGFDNDGASLKVFLSREDIANLSNMTTSNAIRTLSNFANEKIISIDGRKIKILDLARLDRVSKLG